MAEPDLEAQFDHIEQLLAGADDLTGLTQVRSDYGLSGSGQTVAVIDSGVAWNHPALGGNLGPNYRVVGGWDFAEGDANPYDDGPNGGHGTLVTGVIGADRTGTADDGVAPGADLVSLRVFDDNGNSYYAWIESALQWVHQNRNNFENPITAVNISLGDAQWNANTVPNWSTIEDELAQLEADGIFIAVSAGNAFQTYNAAGLSYPAASPHVVPAMSADNDGALTYYSQRHTRAIAAPGRSIVSAIPDYLGNNNGVADDYASYSGTSMSAPYLAGASVLIREAMQFVGMTNVTQTSIFNHMVATADSLYDSATSQWYNRLNLQAAIDALMPADEYGSTSGTAFDLGTLSGATQVSGLIGKRTDFDYFRFTASTTGTVTFTASVDHDLAPVWNGSGSTSGANDENYTLAVVAGQSYTIGLSTEAGIGHYDLTVDTGGGSSNVGPVLAAIGNKSVSEGSLLTFTASATDANSGQTLTYSLASGAPAGATINATTGVFSWTPTEAQGAGSYSVTVRVT
ncbi:MAG: S8 family serine peptidase, partial [Pirellulales bacterium]